MSSSRAMVLRAGSPPTGPSSYLNAGITCWVRIERLCFTRSAGMSPHPRKRRLGAGGHPERRVRSLIGAGCDRGVLEAIVLARVAEGLTLPRLEDDFQRLAEARLALRIRNAVHVVDAREAAAADPEIEAALADVVDGRRLLGDAQRVVQGQDLHRHADPQALGAGGDGARDHDRGRQDRASGREVHLAQPHPVEPPRLGRVDEVEALAKGGRLIAAPTDLELHEDPEVHRHVASPTGP